VVTVPRGRYSGLLFHSDFCYALAPILRLVAGMKGHRLLLPQKEATGPPELHPGSPQLGARDAFSHKPVTATGVEESVVVPLPSWPA
jgi:hypothetical protein